MKGDRSRRVLLANPPFASYQGWAKLLTDLGFSLGYLRRAFGRGFRYGLRLWPNAVVDLSMAHGKRVANAHPGQGYRVDALLAQCDGAAPRTAEDEAWLNDGPAGQEII